MEAIHWWRVECKLHPLGDELKNAPSWIFQRISVALEVRNHTVVYNIQFETQVQRVKMRFELNRKIIFKLYSFNQMNVLSKLWKIFVIFWWRETFDYRIKIMKSLLTLIFNILPHVIFQALQR